MPNANAHFRIGKASSQRPDKGTLPSPRRGVPDRGRIVRLFAGQGHGVIRANGGDVFFHRADLEDGTSINDLHVGDTVAFERLDDRISGARALRVAKRRSRRG
jgi:cold shock CspA family protein